MFFDMPMLLILYVWALLSVESKSAFSLVEFRPWSFAFTSIDYHHAGT